MFFSEITPKILTFEYYAKNKTYSEVNFILCLYQVWSKLIEKCAPKIQDGRHEIYILWHFNIRPRWFPAHHRDRLVFVFFLFQIEYLYHLEIMLFTFVDLKWNFHIFYLSSVSWVIFKISWFDLIFSWTFIHQ